MSSNPEGTPLSKNSLISCSFDRFLAGKVAMVTGASGGGIGEATAKHLAMLGASILVHGRDITQVGRVVNEIRQSGGDAQPMLFDLDEPDALHQACSEVLACCNSIDILIHNAASGTSFKPIETMVIKEWEQDFSTILDASFYLCKHLIPSMKERSFGRIVFVSSSAAKLGSNGRAASYAAAKAGLHGLTKQMALELGQHGITVNLVVPSQIDTPRIKKGGRRTTQSLEAFGKGLPVGRVGTPMEVARMISYLCDPHIGYITGTEIVMDGGASLARTNHVLTSQKSGE